MLTDAMLGLVENEVAGHHWDLGSIPRSPKRFFLFFQTSSYAGLANMFHHEPSMIRRHVAIILNPKAKRRGTPCVPVNKHAPDSKSQTGLLLIGPNCFFKPPLGPSNPPWFYYFLFYFLFSF